MQGFYEKSYNRNNHNQDFTCRDIQCDDINCKSITVTGSSGADLSFNNIECNSIAADGAIVTGGLLTAKNIQCNASGTDGNATVKKVITSSPINEVGGIVLGANDKVTLPSAYTTLPENGQLGNIRTATLNSSTVLTPGYPNVKQITGSGIPYSLTLSPGIYIVTMHLELHNGSPGMTANNYVVISISATGLYRNVPISTKGGAWLSSTTFFAFPTVETTYNCYLYVGATQTYGVDDTTSMFRAMRIG